VHTNPLTEQVVPHDQELSRHPFLAHVTLSQGIAERIVNVSVEWREWCVCEIGNHDAVIMRLIIVFLGEADVVGRSIARQVDRRGEAKCDVTELCFANRGGRVSCCTFRS
jgi:hypothetical protein